MHLPFVVVGCLLREQRGLRQQREKAFAAEGDIAKLAARVAIRVGGREDGIIPHRQDDQRRTHKGLETEVLMNEFNEFAVARDVTRLAIEMKSALRSGTPLASNPRIEGRQEALSSSGNPKPLVNRL